MSTTIALVNRLEMFIDEARSCSMEPSLITPEYVFRMWGGSVSLEGEDKANAMRIVKDLSQLCELDVATTMLIQDEEENVFFGKVACLANMTRKPTFIKGERLFITKDDFTR